MSLGEAMPLPEQVALLAAAAGGCWLLSVLTREYSWVDRIWSIAPIAYVALAARASGGDPRLLLMTALVALWGARLTFNYWRKGGYAPGGEDYRWAELRARMPGWAYQAFNVLFIAGYQNVLLLLFCLPATAIAARPRTPLGGADVALAASFLACLFGEWLSDQQQWAFYQDRAARRARGEDPPGFNTTGLFAWSRHPNFVFEQAQWWIVYLFQVAAGGPWLHPTLAGAVLLTLLFDGSTRFTESLSVAKYPAYREYQRTVGRWFPRPW